MKIKLNTAPASEPVTLADVKTHLRLDSTSLAGNITTSQSIVPNNHAIAASYTNVGAGIDVSGGRAVVNLNSGTNGTGGTVDAKIQESDDDLTYTDWTDGAFTQVTTSNDNAVQEKEYTGVKQYIRVVATVATEVCDFSADVIISEYTPGDESYLSTLITVARQHVEKNVLGGVALINQTWEYYLDDWPTEGNLVLPRPPLSSSTGGITYTLSGETTAYQNTFSSTNYTIDTVSFPGRIVLNYGDEWPTGTLETNNPIKSIFVAGFGATRASVPDEIKQCIMMYISDYYENREINFELMRGMTLEKLPVADNLVAHYRNYGF